MPKRWDHKRILTDYTLWITPIFSSNMKIQFFQQIAQVTQLSCGMSQAMELLQGFGTVIDSSNWGPIAN